MLVCHEGGEEDKLEKVFHVHIFKSKLLLGRIQIKSTKLNKILQKRIK